MNLPFGGPSSASVAWAEVQLGGWFDGATNVVTTALLLTAGLLVLVTTSDRRSSSLVVMKDGISSCSVTVFVSPALSVRKLEPKIGKARVELKKRRNVAAEALRFVTSKSYEIVAPGAPEAEKTFGVTRTDSPVKILRKTRWNGLPAVSAPVA